MGRSRGGLTTKIHALVDADRVRRKLQTAHDGDRQMVEILGAVLTDGLPAVEAA